MAVVANDLSFRRVNEALATMLGYDIGELAGRSFAYLVPDVGEPALRSIERSLLGNVGPQRAEMRLRTRDGRSKWADVSASVVTREDGGGEVMYGFAIVVDINDRKILEDSLRRFAAVAAHELRTPLTTIASVASTLRAARDRLSEEQVDGLMDMLHRQSVRAGTLVADVLDLAQLDGPSRADDLESVRLDAVIADALDAAPPPRGIDLRVEDMDGRVLAASHHLHRVLVNLLTNAYRYGGPHVRVSTTNGRGEAAIVVADDGRGVSADVLPDLFEPFTRGAASRSIPGSGLGLAIARGLAEAAGGNLSYERADGWSRFIVSVDQATSPRV
jgi:PAS domain S-box-containing protein